MTPTAIQTAFLVILMGKPTRQQEMREAYYDVAVYHGYKWGRLELTMSPNGTIWLSVKGRPDLGWNLSTNLYNRNELDKAHRQHLYNVLNGPIRFTNGEPDRNVFMGPFPDPFAS